MADVTLHSLSIDAGADILAAAAKLERKLEELEPAELVRLLHAMRLATESDHGTLALELVHMLQRLDVVRFLLVEVPTPKIPDGTPGPARLAARFDFGGKAGR